MTLGFNGIDPAGRVDKDTLAKEPTAAHHALAAKMNESRPSEAAKGCCCLKTGTRTESEVIRAGLYHFPGRRHPGCRRPELLRAAADALQEERHHRAGRQGEGHGEREPQGSLAERRRGGVSRDQRLHQVRDRRHR